MRILFVCGSIEPGQDGVGDYTRELAGTLNHDSSVEARIISIKDRSEAGVKVEVQESRNRGVKVKRLGAKLSFGKRRQEYLEYIHDFKPNWISLQYVPYAFSPKGLPFDLLHFLEIREVAVKWHFMIHEAYVWQNLSAKLKILKYLEIRILKKLVAKLKPQRIHTSNPFYQKLLENISIDSNILGLFGNIDIVSSNSLVEKSEVKQGVFFGSGPLNSHFSIFSEGIKNLCSPGSETLNIVFCGRPDFRTIDFVKHLKSELSTHNVEIVERGALQNEELSLLLLQSHFGISREAPQLMGKSGTVAVMLEHGLPLWVPLAENAKSFIGKFDFRIEQCKADLNELFKTDFQKRFLPKSRIDDITYQFYTSLKDVVG